jgi:hypothetical protein
MPHLETPDELADFLADQVGVYGAHEDGVCTEQRPCRPCYVSELTARIRQSVKNEALLGSMAPEPLCHWCETRHTGERKGPDGRYCPGPLLAPDPSWAGEGPELTTGEQLTQLQRIRSRRP